MSGRDGSRGAMPAPQCDDVVVTPCISLKSLGVITVVVGGVPR